MHVVKLDRSHFNWSKALQPVLHIKPGETVKFEINEVTSGQITPKSSAGDLTRLDPSKLVPLTGPVFVDGAEPGDALIVRIRNVKVSDWAWTAIIPGMGLLEEFDEPYLWVWKLSKGKYAIFKKGIRIPLRPFCGTIGVAPPDDGVVNVMPPGKHGGNMELKHLTAGSTLVLPVWVNGALFSVGDIHAAQGEGELCIAAIESPGEATFTFDLAKNAKIDTPRFFTSEQQRSRRGYVGTTGMSPDLLTACKQAVRSMIDYLTREQGLTREEAYILCSVAGDLVIHEIVDPSLNVGIMISRDIFPRLQEKKVA
jgi:acetamidase/formamidase